VALADAAAVTQGENRSTRQRSLAMKYFERRVGLHLSVLTVVALAVIAALVLEGLGFALIVAIGLGIVLAIGYPLLVILAEQHDLPIARRRQ
jgi:hypothetical protein